MDNETILERIELLRDCYAWSVQNNQVLTTEQRICLTQERAAWLKVMQLNFLNPGAKVVPTYTIPFKLEDKVQTIRRKIRITGYDRTNYEKQFTRPA